MATYIVSAGHRALGPWTLTASQVDTVEFTDNVGVVQVINDSASTADVWVTADGSVPAVPSAGVSSAALRVPPGGVLDIQTPPGNADGVKLISSGAPTVSIQLRDA